MREPTAIRLTTTLWLLCIIVPVLGLLPWWLRSLEGPWIWHGTAGQWLGLWLILNGAGLAGWCAHLLMTRGQGTPLPLAPPKQFVAAGPYRFVRNPMMLGFLLLLAGEGLLARSRAIFLYGLATGAVLHAVIILVEEPGLRRRFGEGYRWYCQQVPRWIPRPASHGSRGGPPARQSPPGRAEPISCAPTPKAR